MFEVLMLIVISYATNGDICDAPLIGSLADIAIVFRVIHRTTCAHIVSTIEQEVDSWSIYAIAALKLHNNLKLRLGG